MDGQPTGYWAKVTGAEGEPRPPASPIVAWHPQIDHQVDVMACFEALLELPGVQRMLALACGVTQLAPGWSARLSLLVFLHDIGKLNPCFQAKVLPPKDRPPFFNHTRQGHIQEALDFLLFQPMFECFEAATRFSDILEWFTEDGEVSQKAALDMWIAALSHHGRRVHIDPNSICMEEGLPERWGPWRYASLEGGLQQFRDFIDRNFQAAFGAGIQPMPATAELQAVFAGLVSLADWLGSDEKLFPYTQEGDPERLPWARQQARRIIQEVGLDTQRFRKALREGGFDFCRTFGFPPGAEPRPAQATMLDLGSPYLAAGSLVLLESETGSGKTEGAMAHALRLFEADAIDSVYFALPTRTSAVQLHRRVTQAISRAVPTGTPPEAIPPVVLAVPGYFRVDEDNGRPLSRFEVLWPDDGDGRPPSRNWSSENAKRYLAAPIAVGTIDQALMSALDVKHAYMRCASLGRGLLIIDEVHASDTYMAHLSKKLIANHLSLGGSVLLMSATLGGELAQDYIAAATGRPAPKLTLQQALAMEYPLIRASVAGAKAIWLRAPGEKDASAGGTLQASGKSVLMQQRPIAGSPEAVAAMAIEAVEAGAKVLVLRNSVADCIAVQRLLEQRLPPEQMMHLVDDGGRRIPCPHHGRFAADDRVRLDKAVEEHFGKKAPRGRGMVLVATQTVEQSLDIDVDLLLTDVCPMDVLLQRIGRLHRHAENNSKRPIAYRQARCVLLVPEDGLKPMLGAGRGGARKHSLGLDRAYEDIRIVELTLRQVTDGRVILIPQENRELVERSLHSEVLSALDAEEECWKLHGQEIQKLTNSKQQRANFSALDISLPFVLPDGTYRSGADETRVATRLGQMPVMLKFPEPFPSPFGGFLKGISVPHWMVSKGVDVDSVTDVPITVLNANMFAYGGTTFSYTRLGLEKVPQRDALEPPG